MFRRSIFIFLLLLLSKTNFLHAQDLTGTWEGMLGERQFLQLNIVHVKKMLCGYSTDHVLRNKNDSCAAFFTGWYDGKNNEWVLTGSSFIANTGGHELMRLVLSYELYKKEKILKGEETGTGSSFIENGFFSFMLTDSVYLKKVSNTPTSLLGNMKECLDEKNRKKTPVTITPPDKNIQKKLITVKKIPVEPADTLKEIRKPFIPPVIVKDSNIIAQMTKRKNTEASHLVVHDKNIRLEVYDNGIIDSDTVSIFYNGKLILSHKRLSEKAIVIPIVLDEKITSHEIILFAENLGSIPPNTALVVVHAGDKRYELYASASLTENAVIRFEYKPE